MRLRCPDVKTTLPRTAVALFTLFRWCAAPVLAQKAIVWTAQW